MTSNPNTQASMRKKGSEQNSRQLYARQWHIRKFKKIITVEAHKQPEMSSSDDNLNICVRDVSMCTTG